MRSHTADKPALGASQANPVSNGGSLAPATYAELRQDLETCTLAVLVLMNNADPISPLERPSATSCSTSISRGVSPATGLYPEAERPRNRPAETARRSGRPARSSRWRSPQPTR